MNVNNHRFMKCIKLKIRWRLLFACSPFLLLSASLAGQTRPAAPPLQAVIDLIAEDSSMLDDAVFRYETLKGGVNSLYSLQANAGEEKITGRESRHVILLPEAYSYVRLSYKAAYHQDEDPDLRQPLGIDPWLLQDGDTVVIHLSRKRNGVWFSGNAAAKMTCLLRIRRKFRNGIGSFSRSNNLYRQARYSEALEAKKQQFDSLYTVCSGILNEYRPQISARAAALLATDCLAYYYTMMVNHFSLAGDEPDLRASFDDTKKVFMRYFGSFKEGDNRDEGLLTQSYFYADFLLKKDMALLAFRNSSADAFRKCTFEELTDFIGRNYQGMLRDKLLLLAFYRGGKGKNLAGRELSQNLDKAGDSRYGRALREYAAKISTGIPAYNFSLWDETGKVVRLADLRGKLLIMDFWFTGCHGCTLMAEKLKPLAAKYKDNPRVLFVSVSIDRKKDQWLRSVKEEKYSGKHELNLWLGTGTGRCPLPEYYNFDSYPQLMVISADGKLITTSPPDPRRSEEAFISFVEGCL
ncbi:redoxin domain-containing protein [Arcticibacter tournemirensis]|uniref:Redoxin domain-containing protein n=2 Tax=Arcticibacter tournemirensis TaxID=699437 RepID=A0A4Q0MER7_9SPHI|nr:redoxin domain-containing protein [Arcticibacter tournemirensis]